MGSFDKDTNNKPFKSYSEYTQFVFDCVNGCLDAYISKMKVTFANGEGGYKNVLYPDIELAGDACKNRLASSYKERFGKNKTSSDDSDSDISSENDDFDFDFNPKSDEDDFFGTGLSDSDEDDNSLSDDESDIDDELLKLLGSFAADNGIEDENDSDNDDDETAISDDLWDEIEKDTKIPVLERLQIIDERARDSRCDC